MIIDTPNETDAPDINPAPEPPDADLLAHLEQLDAGTATPSPTPDPPNPDAGTPAEPEPQGDVSERLANTWSKLEEREAKAAQREAAAVEREAKLKSLEDSLENPVEYFRQSMQTKYGDGGEEAINRFVLGWIAEKNPELAAVLPDDFKMGAALSEHDAKVRSLEQELANMKKADKEAKEKAAREADIAKAKREVGKMWEQHKESAPFLAVEENPVDVIFDFWAMTPKSEMKDVVERLNELARQRAQRYAHLFTTPAATPTPTAPKPRTNLVGGGAAPTPKPTAFEDMSDEESKDYLIKQLEAGAFSK